MARLAGQDAYFHEKAFVLWYMKHENWVQETQKCKGCEFAERETVPYTTQAGEVAYTYWVKCRRPFAECCWKGREDGNK